MEITKTIGKNTIGDNNKMKVRLRDYEMSTHDLSTVFRSTMAPGVLTPCLKLIAQKGDIFDIQMINKTLTRPTVGPLFGAYKLQHFIFTVPIRLYNSWLHNNRTGIGLKMSDIKLPVINISGKTNGDKLNQSSLLAYLGIRGWRKSGETSQTLCQAIPVLGYLDIFKNYFANTQEEGFFMVTGLTTKPDTVTFSPAGESHRINGRIEFPYITPVGSETITLSKNGGTVSEPTSWYNVWSNILIKVQTVDNTTWENVTKYSSNPNQNKVTLDKLGNGAIGGIQITESALKYFEKSKNNLSKFRLDKIDLIRDTILQTKGNVALNINSTTENTGFDITRAILTSRKSNLGGLLLKTYESDVFQNWIKTDWIDGENGISAISAVAVQDGVITIDNV